MRWRRLPFNQKGADAYCFVDTVIAISPNQRTIDIVTRISTMHLASGKYHTQMMFHACLAIHRLVLSKETTYTEKAKAKVSENLAACY